jgi:ParB-like chromosome segregation protein Spo0J
MQKLIIDPEFEAIIPPLTQDELARLTESLQEDGCRDPLVTWSDNDILLDGHNRYRICRKLSLDYDTVEIDLTDRNEAISWIVRNQLARRNLTPVQRIELAERLRDYLAAKAREKQLSGLKQFSSVGQDLGQREVGLTVEEMDAIYEEETKKIQEEEGRDNRVNGQIAEIAHVSRETVRKVRKIQEEAPEAIEEVRNGTLSVDAAYKKIKGIKNPEWMKLTWNSEPGIIDFIASVNAPKVEIDNAFLGDLMEDPRVDHVMIYFKPKEEEPEAPAEQPPLSEVLDF